MTIKTMCVIHVRPTIQIQAERSRKANLHPLKEGGEDRSELTSTTDGGMIHLTDPPMRVSFPEFKNGAFPICVATQTIERLFRADCQLLNITVINGGNNPALKPKGTTVPG